MFLSDPPQKSLEHELGVSGDGRGGKEEWAGLVGEEIRGRGRRRRRGRGGVFDVVFDSGAGEAGLAHDAADAGVVEDGDDEVVELDLEGEERGVGLVVEGRAAALVRLGALEGRDEGVGEGWGGEERGGRGEAVEGDIEAKLEGARVEWVRGVRVEAGASEEGERGAPGGE